LLIDKAECPNCKNKLRKKRSSQKYCSEKCAISARTHKVEIRCDCCKRTFLRHQYHIGKFNFCSRECYGKWRSANKVGENSSHWKDGTHMQGGYKYIRQADGSYKQEHRFIVEEHLGRPLTDNEVIHHKDGNKLNNDLSNLELTTRVEHPTKHKNRPRSGNFERRYM
jgi:hypothetical protein